MSTSCKQSFQMHFPTASIQGNSISNVIESHPLIKCVLQWVLHHSCRTSIQWFGVVEITQTTFFAVNGSDYPKRCWQINLLTSYTQYYSLHTVGNCTRCWNAICRCLGSPYIFVNMMALYHTVHSNCRNCHPTRCNHAHVNRQIQLYEHWKFHWAQRCSNNRGSTVRGVAIRSVLHTGFNGVGCRLLLRFSYMTQGLRMECENTHYPGKVDKSPGIYTFLPHLLSLSLSHPITNTVHVHYRSNVYYSI